MDILKDTNSEEVKRKVNNYTGFFTGDRSRDAKPRQSKESANEMTITYYDLVTDFYRYGWGDSFHFAPVYHGRSYQQCLVDHEYYLSRKINLQPGMKVLVSL